jgi:hypothetical protein
MTHTAFTQATGSLSPSIGTGDVQFSNGSGGFNNNQSGTYIQTSAILYSDPFTGVITGNPAVLEYDGTGLQSVNILPISTDAYTLGSKTNTRFWAELAVNTINLESNIIPTSNGNSKIGGSGADMAEVWTDHIGAAGVLWSWPTTDTAGVMLSNGSGSLSFTGSPSLTALSAATITATSSLVFTSTLTGPGSFNIDASGNLNATTINMSGNISTGGQISTSTTIQGSIINATSTFQIGGTGGFSGSGSYTTFTFSGGLCTSAS